MSKRDLKKELSDFDKTKLIGLISELYDKNKSVKEYLDYYLKPDEKAILDVYKAKVKEAFYPKRGVKYNLALGKKIITDFRKLSPSPDSLIDLMLYYVECGVEFTNEYGDINENFYSSLVRAYRDAMELIEIHSLHDSFKDKALTILSDTANIGWGFHDTIGDFYFETFAIEEE
jgi:hypothetical protein